MDQEYLQSLGHIFDNPQHKSQKEKAQKQQTNVAPHVTTDAQEQPANPSWLKDCPNKCEQKKSSSGNEQLGAKKPEHSEAERPRRRAAGLQITNHRLASDNRPNADSGEW